MKKTILFIIGLIIWCSGCYLIDNPNIVWGIVLMGIADGFLSYVMKE